MNETYYHVTIASNFVKGFDKYRKVYSKENLPFSTFSEQFFVLKKDELSIGIKKAERLRQKVGIDEDFLIVLETDIGELETYSDHETGLAQYIKQNYISLENVYRLHQHNQMEKMRIEDLVAHSFGLNFGLKRAYDTLMPRSISILPVKSGCQAKCDFCFSTYSVSEDLEKGLLVSEVIDSYLGLAKSRGASRAVITGGGEPTLIPHTKLLDLVQKCAAYFPNKVVLITNAHNYTMQKSFKALSELNGLYEQGLTDLSISRHHYDNEKNEAIMKLHTPIEKLLSLKQQGVLKPNIRLVAVLQKGGIDSKKEIANYLRWAGSFEVTEICFKELYVSSSSESYYYTSNANYFSYQQQVSLSLVLEFCEENGFKKVDELPWGTPIYEGSFQGDFFRIAAYTEPSLYWELHQGLSRSWNIMSNGECLASLEDKYSLIEFNDEV